MISLFKILSVVPDAAWKGNTERAVAFQSPKITGRESIGSNASIQDLFASTPRRTYGSKVPDSTESTNYSLTVREVSLEESHPWHSSMETPAGVQNVQGKGALPALRKPVETPEGLPQPTFFHPNQTTPVGRFAAPSDDIRDRIGVVHTRDSRIFTSPEGFGVQVKGQELRPLRLTDSDKASSFYHQKLKEGLPASALLPRTICHWDDGEDSVFALSIPQFTQLPSMTSADLCSQFTPQQRLHFYLDMCRGLLNIASDSEQMFGRKVILHPGRLGLSIQKFKPAFVNLFEGSIAPKFDALFQLPPSVESKFTSVAPYSVAMNMLYFLCGGGDAFLDFLGQIVDLGIDRKISDIDKCTEHLEHAENTIAVALSAEKLFGGHDEESNESNPLTVAAIDFAAELDQVAEAKKSQLESLKSELRNMETLRQQINVKDGDAPEIMQNTAFLWRVVVETINEKVAIDYSIFPKEFGPLATLCVQAFIHGDGALTLEHFQGTVTELIKMEELTYFPNAVYQYLMTEANDNTIAAQNLVWDAHRQGFIEFLPSSVRPPLCTLQEQTHVEGASDGKRRRTVPAFSGKEN